MFRKLTRTVISVVSLSLAISLAGKFAAAEENKKVYLVGHVNITDIEAYLRDYGAPVFPQLLAAGGEVLSAGPDAEMLEGSSDATWSVIVWFPSMSALQDWYTSEEYQALAPVRQGLTGGTQSVLYVVPEFQGFPD